MRARHIGIGGANVLTEWFLDAAASFKDDEIYSLSIDTTEM